MLSSDLLKKVKQIEITAHRVVDELFSGRFRSHFRGQGMQFREHRLYVPGDDVRHIDWKVSARARDPVVKKYEEERELTVLLLVDVSGSGTFGSHYKLKAEIAAEIAGILAYAADRTGDKVGLVLFTDKVEKTVAPRKGRHHMLRIVRDILHFKPSSKGTDLATALTAADRVMSHSGIVFILSDFICKNYETPLKRLSVRHEVIALWLRDPGELSLPQAGTVCFYNPETDAEVFVDTRKYRFQHWLQEFRVNLERTTREVLKRCRVEVLEVLGHEEYADHLVEFFRRRARRPARLRR